MFFKSVYFHTSCFVLSLYRVYLFKFDLKSGYHHVDIHPDYHTYLGFQWETKGMACYHVFTVLPLGLPQHAICSLKSCDP